MSETKPLSVIRWFGHRWKILHNHYATRWKLSALLYNEVCLWVCIKLEFLSVLSKVASIIWINTVYILYTGIALPWAQDWKNNKKINIHVYTYKCFFHPRSYCSLQKTHFQLPKDALCQVLIVIGNFKFK